MKLWLFFVLCCLDAGVHIVFGAGTGCSNAGGECFFIQCESGYIRVRGTNDCPQPTICCANVGKIDIIDKHLAKVEGSMWVHGYVPTKGSGATIATGYDIGHGPHIAKCVGKSLWSKLKPYRCCRTKDELIKSKLYPITLHITASEARTIGVCLKERGLRKIAQYTKELSICGRAVVLSLYHWCGLAGIKGKDPYSKCEGNSKGKPGHKEDYLWQCLKLGCTDKSLLDALTKLLKAQVDHGRRGFRETRVKNELSFLKGCM